MESIKTLLNRYKKLRKELLALENITQIQDGVVCPSYHYCPSLRQERRHIMAAIYPIAVKIIDMEILKKSIL